MQDPHPYSPTPLVTAWARELNDMPADLSTELGRFPELARLVDLAGSVTAEIQPESYLQVIDGQVDAEVSVRWLHADGQEVGWAQFSIGADDDGVPTFFFDDFHLEWHERARGVGTAYLATVIALCQKLGVRRIRALAGGVGRYALAKAGFRFAADHYRVTVTASAKQFAQRLNVTVPIDLGNPRLEPGDIAAIVGDRRIGIVALAVARGEQTARIEPPMSLGQALLLGPDDNDWEGYLEVPA